MVELIRKPTLKKSGFQMIPDFQWSVFGSPQLLDFGRPVFRSFLFWLFQGDDDAAVAGDRRKSSATLQQQAINLKAEVTRYFIRAEIRQALILQFYIALGLSTESRVLNCKNDAAKFVNLLIFASEGPLSTCYETIP